MKRTHFKYGTFESLNLKRLLDDARHFSDTHRDLVVSLTQIAVDGDYRAMPECEGVVTPTRTCIKATANFKTALASKLGHLVERMARRKKGKKLNGFDKVALTRSIGADEQRDGTLVIQFRFGEVLKVSEVKHARSRLGGRVRDG